MATQMHNLRVVTSPETEAPKSVKQELEKRPALSLHAAGDGPRDENAEQTSDQSQRTNRAVTAEGLRNYPGGQRPCRLEQ